MVEVRYAADHFDNPMEYLLERLTQNRSVEEMFEILLETFRDLSLGGLVQLVSNDEGRV